MCPACSLVWLFPRTLTPSAPANLLVHPQPALLVARGSSVSSRGSRTSPKPETCVSRESVETRVLPCSQLPRKWTAPQAVNADAPEGETPHISHPQGARDDRHQPPQYLGPDL